MKKTITTLATLAALTGCAEAPPTAGARAMPNEVQAIVEARCVSCHSSPPMFGAPMALGSWDAMQEMSVREPGRRVFEVVADRIHDERMPMPPGGMLAADELGVLDRWIADGAPAGDGTVGPGPGPGPQVGPEHLPCTPSAEFRAFAPGDTTAPYRLEPAADGNTVLCFAFPSPFAAGEVGTAFAPIIDDERVLHHWIIFGSASLPAGIGAGDIWECGTGGMTSDSRFLTGWAPGGRNIVMPETLGRELPGPGEFIVLQVHYWNVRALTDVADRSGVALCSSPTPREHTVGTSTLGSLDIAIPPRSRDVAVVGHCTPDITEPVTIIASGLHMHTHGRSIRTEVLRAGSESDVVMLGGVQAWDFNQQTGVAAPGGALVINPGDVLRTTCVYDNPTDTTIYFGERTEDEMCFNFVSAYPAGALANAAGRSRRLCIE